MFLKCVPGLLLIACFLCAIICSTVFLNTSKLLKKAVLMSTCFTLQFSKFRSESASKSRSKRFILLYLMVRALGQFMSQELNLVVTIGRRTIHVFRKKIKHFLSSWRKLYRFIMFMLQQKKNRLLHQHRLLPSHHYLPDLLLGFREPHQRLRLLSLAAAR